MRKADPEALVPVLMSACRRMAPNAETSRMPLIPHYYLRLSITRKKEKDTPSIVQLHHVAML